MKSHIIQTLLLLAGLLLSGCEPLVNQFNDIEDAVMYQASSIKEFGPKKSIKVITTNTDFSSTIK